MTDETADNSIIINELAQDTNDRHIHQFSFNGSAGEYFRIWIVNLCLTIITLGIYSAWAKVRTHQYFYANTRVANEQFDYLANPLNILKGRVIALVAFIIYMITSQFFPLIAPGFGLIFLAVLPWLVVRSMSFRNFNSAYRNIRFGFNRNYRESYWVFAGLLLLLPLTLGLIYPYVQYRQKRFLIDNARYGESQFNFKGGIREFYDIYFTAVMIGIAGFVIIFLAQMVLAEAFNNLLPALAFINVGLFPLFMFALYAFIYGYINANVQNYLYNQSNLDSCGFTSTLSPMGLASIYATNTLAIMFSFGLMIPWAMVRTARYRADNLTLNSDDLDSFTAKQGTGDNAIGEEVGEMFDAGIGL